MENDSQTEKALKNDTPAQNGGKPGMDKSSLISNCILSKRERDYGGGTSMKDSSDTARMRSPARRPGRAYGSAGGGYKKPAWYPG